MRWYLLIHQLPPKPLYLRAKIRNRLDKVGAVALKNSVYVLPLREDCLEDFQWIAQEATAGGGEAYICEMELVSGISQEALVRRFNRNRDTAYEALKAEIAEAVTRMRTRRGLKPPGQDLAGAVLRFQKGLEEIGAADFFGAPARKEAEALLRSLKTRLHGGKSKNRFQSRRKHPDLLGRVWVTRPGVRVDRIASAWLVRRFIDPGACFRFVDPKTEPKQPGEIRFDMVGGDFTHEGERCTFETLLAYLSVADSALSQIAEIVHDIDLKDGKYARPDTPGVQQLILGLVRAHPDDDERLERGFALFDDLYASFQGETAVSRSQPRSGPAAQRGRSKRSRPPGSGRPA